MIVHGPLLLASVLAMLAYALVAALPEPPAPAVRSALAVAWIAHAAAVVIDVAGIGSGAGGARFGFGPSLSATLWLVVGVYAIESRWMPAGTARRVLAGAAIVAVALALFYPGQFHPHADSPLAPLHWLLGLASYGLFGAAVLHALLLDSQERRMRSMARAAAGAAPTAGALGMPLLRLERLTFRFVLAGFVVLSAAIVLGLAFAPHLRWDHKTVFSLLGWAVFASLLGGRHAFGWRGRRATRWLYVGAGLLLLAYAGSRFVLEVLLRRPGAA